MHTNFKQQLLGAPSLSPSKAQPPSQSQILAPAIAALRRAAEQRAPRAIMAHLLAASRHVTRALVACRRDGTLPGADEVLPTLILAVKEGNPPGLRVALEVAQRYRQPKGLQVSEAAYVFTNVASAVHFLQTVNARVVCVVIGLQRADCSRSWWPNRHALTFTSPTRPPFTHKRRTRRS